MIHLKDMSLELFCNGLFQVRLQVFAVFSGLNNVKKISFNESEMMQTLIKIVVFFFWL